jgi:hypothetical protein
LEVAFDASLRQRAKAGQIARRTYEDPQKPKALCVTAERLEGSPPPELPDYASDCASVLLGSKYIFRN